MPYRRAVLLWLAIVAYAAGFLWWYPSGLLVSDEALYVEQAEAFATGRILGERPDPFTGATRPVVISDYAPGTSLLMVPLVKLGGEPYAHLLALLAVIAAVGCTARWLRESGLAPEYAVLLLLYPPTLVVGRLCMSDAPSLAAASFFLWSFYRGRRTGAAGWSFVAGLSVGIATLIRETNAVILVPFFVRAVWQRDPTRKALFAGAALGVAMWAGVYGTVHHGLIARGGYASAGFSLAHVPANLPLGLVCLLGLMPLGTLWMALFRDTSKPELVAAYAIGAATYLLWSFNGSEGGFTKGLVLGGRFYMPLLPIAAFATASCIGRWWSQARTGLMAERTARAGLATKLRLALGVVIAIPLFASHRVLQTLTAQAHAVQLAIEEQTAPRALLVTNLEATQKYLRVALRSRRVLDLAALSDPAIITTLRTHAPFQVVVLYRSDSPFWTGRAAAYDRWITSLDSQVPMVRSARRTLSSTTRLEVWSTR